jgi:hypothetical protein
MFACRGFLLPLLAATLLAAAAPAAAAENPNAAGFRPITDWRPYRGSGTPSAKWHFDGNLISLTPGGGDIVSVEEFDNFELDFDWKISPGGNSGVMYRVSEASGAPFDSGPEYQILDNATAEGGDSPLTAAASCYGIYPVSANAALPAGEWNTARIIVQGNHVEHWLNGRKVVDYELGSADWKHRVASSKFKATPIYGTVSKGHIDLQDHGSAVTFRNVRVEPLPAP